MQIRNKKKCIKKIEKCIRLLVQIVKKKQKCLSNQMVADPSTVRIVFKNINQEDFKFDYLIDYDLFFDISLKSIFFLFVYFNFCSPIWFCIIISYINYMNVKIIRIIRYYYSFLLIWMKKGILYERYAKGRICKKKLMIWKKS